MALIIDIPQEKISKISSLGIHFTYAEGDEDFILFALCYQSLATFLTSDTFPQMTAHLYNHGRYLQLLDKFNLGRIAGIYDDLNRPDRNIISFVSNMSGVDTIFRFLLDDHAAYTNLRLQIEATGWQIINSSDLLSV